MKREKTALVVMSTRACVGILRFFFSDIADKVLQQVDIPVLLALAHGRYPPHRQQRRRRDPLMPSKKWREKRLERKRHESRFGSF